jgi:hypothetical protein
MKKIQKTSWAWCYIPLILATQEAEAGGSWIQGQARQSYPDDISKMKQKIWVSYSDGWALVQDPGSILSTTHTHTQTQIPEN